MVNNISDWFIKMVDMCNNGKRAAMVTTCWAVWKARNDLVWNQKHSLVNRVVATAKQYLIQCKFTQGR